MYTENSRKMGEKLLRVVSAGEWDLERCGGEPMEWRKGILLSTLFPSTV